MQIIKHKRKVKSIVLGMSTVALAVSTAHAAPSNSFEFKIGNISCGQVELKIFDIENRTIQANSFISNDNCTELGVVNPGTTEPEPGTTEPEPGTTEPEPGTTEPEPGSNEPALLGGKASTDWGSAIFPIVPSSRDYINQKMLKGGSNKYTYYKINTTNLAKGYKGMISLVTTPGSGNAQFSMWISRTPGGEPLSNSCKSAVMSESYLRYTTGKPKIYECGLGAEGTYYLNVTDRPYEQLGGKGYCAAGAACQYLLEASGSRI